MFDAITHSTDILILAFTSTLVAFVMGSTLLTVWTWYNSRRLRNCIQQWRDPGLHGVPMFPALFLTLAVAASAYHMSVGESAYRVYEVAYVWLGLNWYAAYHLMSKRYITDNGIVKNINDPSQTIAWTRINDYLELSREGFTEFTFFFTSSESGQLRSHRIKLKVPDKEYEAFRRLLTYKVDRHLARPWSETTDIERLL